MAAPIKPCQQARPTRVSTKAVVEKVEKRRAVNQSPGRSKKRGAEMGPKSKVPATTHVRRSEGTVRAPPSTDPVVKIPQATVPPRKSLVSLQFSNENGR